MAYQNNAAILEGVSDAINSKRIANNTVRYERANGDTVYRLHNTDIVIKHTDGTFTLNSGGWKTPTTKDRLNTYAPCNIRSVKGMWLIGDVVFFDGIKVGADGRPVNASDDESKEAIAHVKDLKKKIAKFVKLIDTVEVLPTPNNGDCWHCSMFDREPAKDKEVYEFNHVKGQSGPSNNANHLISHMDEEYLHGSLLVNAMRWRGYSDTGISIYYGMAARGDRSAFKRALRDYLKRKLGLV